eukprot:12567716-Prorocentrum_lima.AAC.1
MHGHVALWCWWVGAEEGAWGAWNWLGVCLLGGDGRAVGAARSAWVMAFAAPSGDAVVSLFGCVDRSPRGGVHVGTR